MGMVVMTTAYPRQWIAGFGCRLFGLLQNKDQKQVVEIKS